MHIATIDITRSTVAAPAVKSAPTLEEIEAAVAEHRNDFEDIEVTTSEAFRYDYSSYGEDREDVQNEIDALEEYAADTVIQDLIAKFNALAAAARPMEEAYRDAADRADAVADECVNIVNEATASIEIIDDARRQLTAFDDGEKSRRPTALAIKSFLADFPAPTLDALLAADGGQDLWDEYQALAAEIDRTDIALAEIDAALDDAAEAASTAESEAERVSGNLDPAARSAIYAEFDRLSAEQASLADERARLYADAARIEGDMLAVID